MKKKYLLIITITTCFFMFFSLIIFFAHRNIQLKGEEVKRLLKELEKQKEKSNLYQKEKNEVSEDDQKEVMFFLGSIIFIGYIGYIYYRSRTQKEEGSFVFLVRLFIVIFLLLLSLLLLKKLLENLLLKLELKLKNLSKDYSKITNYWERYKPVNSPNNSISFSYIVNIALVFLIILIINKKKEVPMTIIIPRMTITMNSFNYAVYQ